MNALTLSRRATLVGGGALVVGFALPGGAVAQEAAAPSAAKLPGSLKEAPQIDSWIRIDANGAVTVFTGKAELGQGVKTAILQIAAEELGVQPTAITLVTADTARTPNEGYTAGSHSMQDSGTAILYAAATARAKLTAVAATQLGVDATTLNIADGAVSAPDGRHLSFGALVAGDLLHVPADPTAKLRDPASYRFIGSAMPRVDIPGKVTGAPAYIQDMRPAGMLHARVLRQPSYGARLVSYDEAAISALPGNPRIVRNGNFLAVVAAREFDCIRALRRLGLSAKWDETAELPDQPKIYDVLKALPSEDHLILNNQKDGTGAAVRTVQATFHRPYQGHGSIGPSCAIATFKDGQLTVWSHAQGMFPLRAALADLTRLPPAQVRCIHVEGSGCYGHNGADDAAGDAALIAQMLPDTPIRVQWMRDDEHSCEPYGPAMIAEAQASLDATGMIVDWSYAVWSNTHATRPSTAGWVLAGTEIENPFTPPPPKPLPLPEGGGDRNAIPLYVLPNAQVTHHFISGMPIRVSAMRGLGAYTNIFAIESFMDELARAGGIDPVMFRLRHLQDSRARDVVTTAADRFGWTAGHRLPQGRGRGFAFARYKNLGAYAAIAVEVAVEHETGRVRIMRVVAATDSGQAINPDGIRNQIEGGIVQAASWTLYEAVTFDRRRITSRDWSSYPILRFPAVPEVVEVHVINRPGAPYLGTGEAAQGPTSAALANAIADATGQRLTELPLTATRIKFAIGV